MQLIVISVKDTAAQAFGRPIFVPSAGVAVRSFRDEVNRSDANNDMNRHPDDFELYRVGMFDDSDGSLVGCSPELLARAKDLKE